MPKRCSLILVLAFCLAAATPAAAEAIRIGILKVASSGPVYLARDMGFFAAEGLTTELVNFESGQSVAVAVVAGDVDMGVTGLTAGLYNMGAKGEMRVIAGFHREAPGFRVLGYFASRQAYEAGLRRSRICRAIRWRSRRSARPRTMPWACWPRNTASRSSASASCRRRPSRTAWRW